jgi:class 3 adenylate cyclase
VALAPETRYARDGENHLAYQVLGDGDDLLYLPTGSNPIDLMWDEPVFARGLHRLASFSRLITSDLVGVGSSDAVAVDDMPAMQAWSDGIRAVLDEVDSGCTGILATAESALPAMLFAASNPGRVRALVLWSPYAYFVRCPDQPFGMPETTLRTYLDSFRETVGRGPTADLLAPTRAADPAFRRWWARGERLSGGPGYFVHVLELFLRSDARPVLRSIQAPTLVMRRRGDRHVRDGHARAIADTVPNARLIELDGDDDVWFAGETTELLDHVESFLTGKRTIASTTRVLSTVLFTDIVDSTKHAAALGDAEWKSTLETHHALVERYVAAFRGSVVHFTGDGVLATFDGPARAIQCATSIRDAVHELGIEIRAGLHTGEIEIVDDDVAGIAVHVAARIMALAGTDEVYVSGSIPPLVLGAGLQFEDRGRHTLKGVPDAWPVFAVVDGAARISR